MGCIIKEWELRKIVKKLKRLILPKEEVNVDKFYVTSKELSRIIFGTNVEQAFWECSKSRVAYNRGHLIIQILLFVNIENKIWTEK